MITVGRWRAELEARATPVQKASAEAYFKGAIPFLGVKGPAVDEVFAASVPELRVMDVDERLALSEALLGAEPAELRHLGVLTLARFVKSRPSGVVRHLAPLFATRATNWGTADALAGRFLRYCLPNAEDRAVIVGWRGDESPWLRRMACVAFVNEARKGGYIEEIWQVVPGALALDHRFAQLGAGWLLRERWLAAPGEVEAFLRASGKDMHRGAVRYAIEKMPTAARAELLAATRP